MMDLLTFISSLKTFTELQQNSSLKFSLEQKLLHYRFLFSECFIPPLLILPESLGGLSFTKSRLTDEPLKKSTKTNNASTGDIMLPQVDPIITSYANSYTSVAFSLRMLRFLLSPANSGKLFVADNKYSQEAFSYYKENPSNISQLESLIKCEEENYRQKLAQVKFTTKRKSANGTEREFILDLTAKQVNDFIKLVKADVDKNYLDKFFQQPKQLILEKSRFVEKVYTAEELLDLRQIKAMFDVIVIAEGTGNDYGKVANGTVVKSPYYPDLVGKRNVSITDFSRHPEITVDYGPDYTTAAGRYQFLYKTWQNAGGDSYDFSPRSQDTIAVKLMMRRKMIEPLLNGNVRLAINRGAPEWASFPMANGKSYYKQPVKNIEVLEKIYNESLKKY